MSNGERPSYRFFSFGPGAPDLVELVNQLSFLIRKKLWLQIVVAMCAGLGVGLLLAPTGAALVSETAAEVVVGWLALPGHLFLALIQMIVVPLVASSIVLGIAASEDPAYLRRIALRIAPYFVGTTTIAVGIGIVLVSVIEPGGLIDPATIESTLAVSSDAAPAAVETASTSLHDQILGIIPTNPLGAALDQSMLQIVVFSIMVAIALMSIPRNRALPLLDLAGSVQQISMEIVSWAMVLAPLAVFGLLAQVTATIGLDALGGMAAYIGTVVLGLLLLLSVYIVLVRIFAGVPAREFLKHIREVQLLAFSTSSSAAVMPLSIRTAQEHLGVRPRVAQFIVPLGATINMDGTALYQVVAAVFLTQVFGVELSTGALLLLVATTVGASIGSPSTPGVGIVILATILQSIGVPVAGVALIIGVDRILDMSRTAINVSGDLAACAIMEKWLPATPDSTGPDEARDQERD